MSLDLDAEIASAGRMKYLALFSMLCKIAAVLMFLVFVVLIIWGLIFQFHWWLLAIAFVFWMVPAFIAGVISVILRSWRQERGFNR